MSDLQMIHVPLGAERDATVTLPGFSVREARMANGGLRWATAARKVQSSGDWVWIDVNWPAAEVAPAEETYWKAIITSVNKLAPEKVLLTFPERAGARAGRAVAVTAFLDVFRTRFRASGPKVVGIEALVIEALGKKLEEIRGRAATAVEEDVTLVAENGRLDAKAIAHTFGMNPSQLSRAIGVPNSTVADTPDSKGLQEKLRPFADIAKLLVLHSDVRHFRAWLNEPAVALGGSSPLALIIDGKVAVVRDFAGAILNGGIA